MAKTAAERQKDRYARKKRGESVLPIKCNAGAIADWLVDQGELPEWSTEDIPAITAALERRLAKFLTREDFSDVDQVEGTIKP
jgi:hypothetical protein